MGRRFEDRARRYQDRVYTYARYLLADADEAADVTQKVLLALWRRGGDLEEDGVWPWLVRVTRNACIDVMRGRQRKARVLVPEAQVPALEAVAGPAADPSHAVQAGDFAANLQAALDKLPEVQRSIVILREVQSMSYDEIARALDMPLTRVKVYLHRGRRRLRTLLEAYADHEV